MVNTLDHKITWSSRAEQSLQVVETSKRENNNTEREQGILERSQNAMKDRLYFRMVILIAGALSVELCNCS